MIQYTIGQKLPPIRRPAIFAHGDLRWHVLLTLPQREDAAKAWLETRDVYSAYPVKEAWRIRPRSRIQRQIYYRKYLPGYLFAKFPGDVILHHLLDCPFIHDVMRMSSGAPGVLHPETLSKIMALVRVDTELEERKRAERKVKAGDVARIADGAYEGWEVEIVEITNGKARFQVKLLGMRDVEIEVHRLRKVTR